MAIPRIGMPGAQGIALPQPLSPGDAAAIRRIFAAQRAGAITEATKLMEELDSVVLRGAILADRYLDTAYIPEPAELSAWLAWYGDQPDAQAIRVLLRSLTEPAGGQPEGASPNVVRPDRSVRKIPNGPTARMLLTQNDDRAAMRSAQALFAAPATHPGDKLAADKPAADKLGWDKSAADNLFAGGVAAWRLNDVASAKPLFEAAWHAAVAAPSRAAAAFWVARVAEKSHDHASRIFWLRRAANEPETFYGPIARRALDPTGVCRLASSVSKPVVSNADVDALMATGPGQRGFALLQVGERQRAEAELRALWSDLGPRPALARSVILVAKAVGLDQFADELREDSSAAEAASDRFELPLLRPAGGFRMDPAFVYAVVRHESNFRPLAVSPFGARGLMQVMPATAVSLGAIGHGQGDRLNDPSTNLAVGQRYLIQLGDNPLVGDDLFRLIAAYGQGPAGMNRWAETIRDRDDPFVFLEAMPSAFMRQFVEDVLVFHWQYAAALRTPAISLDDLAAGVYPRFTPIKSVSGGDKTHPDACPFAASLG